MKIDPDKYVVFKRVEYNNFLEVLADDKVSLWWAPSALDDAVVIRKRDVFASGVFYGYASSVMAAAEVMEQSTPPGQDWPRDLHTLRDVAEYFMAMGDEARQILEAHGAHEPTP